MPISKRILIPLAILFILAASAFAWMAYRANEKEKEKAKQARGIHQNGPIYVQNNNTYLPGLNSTGQPTTQPAATQPQPRDSWNSPQPAAPTSAPATWPSTAPHHQ